MVDNDDGSDDDSDDCNNQVDIANDYENIISTVTFYYSSTHKSAYIFIQ